MCNNKPSEGNCIADILKVISVLQQNASCGDSCLDSCDRGFLGCGSPCFTCNTRPVMLYCGCEGIAWSMPTSKEPEDDTTIKSNVFRVEKLDDNCATFRVLAPNPDTTDSMYPYVATNSFFTFNLNCVCCIRCLPDTYVDCI